MIPQSDDHLKSHCHYCGPGSKQFESGLDQGHKTRETYPDGDKRGGVERSEQHGVTKHEDEARGQGDLKGGVKERHYVS